MDYWLGHAGDLTPSHQLLTDKGDQQGGTLSQWKLEVQDSSGYGYLDWPQPVTPIRHPVTSCHRPPLQLGMKPLQIQATLPHNLSAWWHGTNRTDELEAKGVTRPNNSSHLAILSHLNRRWTGRDGRKTLMKILKTKSHKGYMPCERDVERDCHHIQVHDCHRGMLRVRCRNCDEQMEEGEAMGWFALLVSQGHVTLEDVDYHQGA